MIIFTSRNPRNITINTLLAAAWQFWDFPQVVAVVWGCIELYAYYQKLITYIYEFLLLFTMARTDQGFRRAIHQRWKRVRLHAKQLHMVNMPGDQTRSTCRATRQGQHPGRLDNVKAWYHHGLTCDPRHWVDGPHVRMVGQDRSLSSLVAIVTTRSGRRSWFPRPNSCLVLHLWRLWSGKYIYKYNYVL